MPHHDDLTDDPKAGLPLCWGLLGLIFAHCLFAVLLMGAPRALQLDRPPAESAAPSLTVAVATPASRQQP